MFIRKRRIRQMIVREHVPGRVVLIVAVVVLVLVSAVFSAWMLGRHSLLVELSGGDGHVDLVERLATENQDLKGELAALHGNGDVSRAVEERMREDNRDLQDRVAELEQAVAYYRRVAVPDPAGKGLLIAKVDVYPGGNADGWELSALLVRTGETDGAVEGGLEGSLTLRGPQGLSAVPLAKASDPKRLLFNVRYAAEMRVPLHVPAGQIPVRVDFAAVLSKPRPDRVGSVWKSQGR